MFKTQIYTSKAWTETFLSDIRDMKTDNCQVYSSSSSSSSRLVVVVVAVVVLDGERCLSEQLRLYAHGRALS